MSQWALRRRLLPLLFPAWLARYRAGWARNRAGRPDVGLPGVQRRRPCLYIDVTVISRHDAGTGIQRVVRSIATELLSMPLAEWEVVAVAATRKRPYRRVAWPHGEAASDSHAMEARPGDVFLGLDFALDAVCTHERQLRRFRHDGGRLWFLMYDLLPAQRPDWFPDSMVVRFRRWLDALARLADGFFCISANVEEGLRQELLERYGLAQQVMTRVIPMGADFQRSNSSRGLPAGFDVVMGQLALRPTVLVVGTIEPRKGQAQVLAAFDVLWARGIDMNLVLVGRPGWKTDDFQSSVQQHRERNQRLFWLPDASDQALGLLYEGCSLVVVASFAEGFGLPLIEALKLGKPVLARDIPVFRQHAERCVTYFSVDADAVGLAGAIEALMPMWVAGMPGQGARIELPAPTWADSARELLAQVRANAVA